MTTRACEALRSIMLDPEEWLGSRIEAAEGLLSFEAPDDAVAEAKAFLTAVFENEEEDTETRLGALKLVRKAEARRVSQGTIPGSGDVEARRSLWLRMALTRRRLQLIEADLWPPPREWRDDLVEMAQTVPESDLPSITLPENPGAALSAARLRRQSKQTTR